ncbi:MAG: penicillin-binding transpeptidase domain-containing protein [Candidatus Contendobacter sp.]|nr:penicillin-binding transpeptidase domain-containing protein [Candidatus Contendobacter sp.]MDG4557604.1 penicillin-binding transpeptidase domain-containing protein [Candidatus Contendobacter sp.]
MKNLAPGQIRPNALRAMIAFAQTTTRRGLVLGLLGAAAGGLVARAAYMQVINTDFFQNKGAGYFVRTMDVPAHRGMILDRNGEPLAVSSPVDSIWVDPREFLDQRDRWPQLATALEMTTAELEQKLAGRGRFAWLRRHLAPSVAQRILALDIPGVYARREYRRYYPDAEVTSHLLGFTDIDDAGQDGLEKMFESRLRGIPGQKRVIQDRLGRVVAEVENLRAPQPGQTQTLSIDRRLQYLAYRALKTAVVENKANAGAAVIVDVRTGEILAMVNQPAGNPNNRAELHGDLLRNRAITDVCEPGSTVKPFTAALGLESGKWTPNTLVDTTPMRIGRYMVRDTHNYGTIDVTHVISKSSNVGVTKIALSMPAERLWQLYKNLGFGAPTGVVGKDSEQTGVLRHFSKWAEIGHANHSFGYGFSLTILQLAQAYVVLAADGVRRPLTLLKREQPLDPADERRVLSARAVRQVRAMMEEVVTRQGTGLKANVPGYRVAGKTGTARKIAGGHYTSRYFALFAGIAPASDPRLVMVILIDEPKGGAYYGGTVAAPVFSATMGGALRILNVTPDDLPNLRVAGAEPTAGATP